MIKKCPDCGSLNVEEDVFDNESYCKDCFLHCATVDLEYASVFDQITQSPEVLAERLVYRTIEIAVNRATYSCWKSTITEESYRTKTEAHAATVARLKEAANGN